MKLVYTVYVDACQVHCPNEDCQYSGDHNAICIKPTGYHLYFLNLTFGTIAFFASGDPEEEKLISIIVGAVSGAVVAVILMISLIIIFKVKLRNLFHCCQPTSLKNITSTQYYRNNTFSMEENDTVQQETTFDEPPTERNESGLHYRTDDMVNLCTVT